MSDLLLSHLTKRNTCKIFKTNTTPLTPLFYEGKLFADARASSSNDGGSPAAPNIP